jgi:hypothetical protein
MPLGDGGLSQKGGMMSLIQLHRNKPVESVQLSAIRFDIYPHPYANSGWFIGIHPERQMFWNNSGATRYESKVSAKRGANKLLKELRDSIDDYIKEADNA